MSYNWEMHHAVINYGNPVTRKTVDVSGRVFVQNQIEARK